VSIGKISSENPQNMKEFSVTFFPKADYIISIESEHKAVTELKTRLTVRPSHRELMCVGVKKAE